MAYKKFKTQKLINFILAEELLEDTNKMCEDIGMTQSEAIRRGLKHMIQEWKNKAKK